MSFIELTLKYSEEGDKISINPTMIESLETRKFSGQSFTDVGLFSGRRYDVIESKEQIIKMMRVQIINYKDEKLFD